MGTHKGTRGYGHGVPGARRHGRAVGRGGLVDLVRGRDQSVGS